MNILLQCSYQESVLEAKPLNKLKLVAGSPESRDN